jgi:carboxymethylenebutenolidase
MTATTATSPQTSEDISLTAADGHVLHAYLARPRGAVRGALVVVQDAFGVGAYIRSVCDSYAADGYAAIAPSIYDRQQRNAVFDHTPELQAMARRCRAGLDWEKVITDIAAARNRVSEHGRVGIVGFCVGGSIAWLAAARLPFAAASSYYGKDVVGWLDQPPQCPTVLHFGDHDRLIPLADIEAIRAAHPDIPTFIYPTGHGFDGVGRGHHPDSAALARSRTLAHFRAHIG